MDSLYATLAAGGDEGQVLGRRRADDGDFALSGHLPLISVGHFSKSVVLSCIFYASQMSV